MLIHCDSAAPPGLQERTPADALEQAARLHAAGDCAAGAALVCAALRVRPEHPALHNAYGVMLAGLGRFTEAVASYRTALRLGEAESGVWTNLGNALTRLGLLESALHCHRNAIARAPENAGLHYNFGITLAESGRHGEAVAMFGRALALDPGHPMARWDRGRSYLHLGNYAAGWPDYEVRLQNGLVPPRACPGARWDGSPFPGRRLVLLAEQGFGDMIWAHRYLPLVKALGGEVVLECPRELAGLFAQSGLADSVVVQGAALPQAELHAFQCSLPGLFTRTAEAIPGAPYLAAAPAGLAALRPAFAAAPAGTLRVGVVWSGSTTFARNAERAQTLARFITAFDLPGVQLYSLQKGTPAAELEQAAPHRVVDLAPRLGGFDDTAAALAQLDLVIMTDTAVAHLAGAMGVPVWVLLGRPAHWLWMHERRDSPWYPSMTLIRGRGGADWDHVFDQAAAALLRLAERLPPVTTPGLPPGLAAP